MDTVEAWGRAHGCDKLVGSLGFTDMDPEGMLTGGYDQLSTMSTTYNYPYYPTHMERLGYTKEVDWVERKIRVPDRDHQAHMDKYFRVAEMSAKRYNLHVRKFKSAREIPPRRMGTQDFQRKSTKHTPQLYGYSEMKRAADRPIRQHLPSARRHAAGHGRRRCRGRIIAMGVGMPSLSHALQKAKSRLFPFGWYHLVKALFFKHSDIIDLLLVAVLPEYQNKGVNAMLFADLIPICQQMGFKFGETHPQLETNEKSQGQWAYLDAEVHKHRRCYQKSLK